LQDIRSLIDAARTSGAARVQLQTP
jgi:hypothetical protein